ncbi:hypothetical protein BC938DRAFT_473132, partial [Jimgerdemannia flammicorona]
DAFPSSVVSLLVEPEIYIPRPPIWDASIKARATAQRPSVQQLAQEVLRHTTQCHCTRTVINETGNLQSRDSPLRSRWPLTVIRLAFSFLTIPCHAKSINLAALCRISRPNRGHNRQQGLRVGPEDYLARHAEPPAGRA